MSYYIKMHMQDNNAYYLTHMTENCEHTTSKRSDAIMFDSISSAILTLFKSRYKYFTHPHNYNVNALKDAILIDDNDNQFNINHISRAAQRMFDDRKINWDLVSLEMDEINDISHIIRVDDDIENIENLLMVKYLRISDDIILVSSRDISIFKLGVNILDIVDLNDV